MYATNNASLLTGVWNILESYGIDPELLFRQLGLNPELMKQSGGRYRLDSIDNPNHGGYLWQRIYSVSQT
jgi:hypothetical protein